MGDDIGYLAEEVSDQSIQRVGLFFLNVYSKMQKEK